VKDAHRASADGNRVLMMSRVECRLAAAGLPRVEDDLASTVFEDRYRGFGRFGSELVDQAGDEESDPHG
jgi:hypothetical protein